MPVLSSMLYLKMTWNSREWDSSIGTINVDDCYVHVGLELLNKEHLIVNLFLLGFVIPVVGFYRTLAMPITQASLRLLME